MPGSVSARTLRLVLVVLVAALAACALPRHAEARPPAAKASMRYAVEIPAPHQQYVHVTMAVDSPAGRRTRVAMPAWAPGSYLVRDFARHVYDLEAVTTRGGRALPVERLDKQTWRVEHGGRPFTVRYRVFAAEASVRTSHVDDLHASLLGSSVFLYVVGELGRPATVDVALPQGWSAHSALEPREGAPAGAVRLFAPDYDTLVDSPIELGTPVVRRFSVDGAAFEYVLTGAEGTAIDVERLAADAERVARAQGELMGGFPFARYVFLLRVSPHGGGGLEHASSTSMMMRRADFDDDAGYARAARLAAHELFHAWNVKRIHDRALGPFDYSKEVHSRLLWLHEGCTETMEAQSLVRAGLQTPEAYLRDLGERWTAYVAKPGRNHDPISAISFEAWIKAYKPAPNHANVAVSYYEKGDLLGVALDLELRLRAAERGREGSLAGLLRRLMKSHGVEGRGITEDDVIVAAGAEAGEDMAWFFARHVDGTEEVPLLEALGRAGIEVRASAPWLDAEGRPRGELTRAQRSQRIHAGLELSEGAQVRNVEPGSPADAAGLMLEDEIVAVEGLEARTRATVLARFADRDPGDTISIALFRSGRLIERSLTLAESPARSHVLSLRPDAELTPAQRRVRDAWLGRAPR